MLDTEARQNDSIATLLRTYAQHILLIIFGLLPLLFVPLQIAPFEYTKAAVVVVGIFIALVLYSLSVLRSGVVSVGISYPLCALWLVTAVTYVSTLLSGDIKDAFIGDLFSIHSAVFVTILALVPTVWMLLQPTKAVVLRLYMLLALSTLLIVSFHFLRIFFGPEFLSFSIFTGNVSTPVGSWNDLGLFLGLTVIIALIALEQLTLSKVGRLIFVLVTVLSLIMLGVINFFTVWLVLGVTSLAMIVYALGKDRFSEMQLPLMGTPSGVKSLGMALLVFASSVIFVVGGSSIGGWVAQHTGITYVEVRPSVQATADIARHVYSQNVLLGIGPNKFTDAWRLYKDPSINTTIFWNTDFNAGNSYISTFFVTTGILGGVVWLIFLATYFVTGVRRLLNATSGDKVWYFIGVSSFVSALYVWGMSLVYVPGVVILLLGALCTGISLYVFTIIQGNTGTKIVSVAANRRTGFILTLAVIVVIIGSVSVLYVAGRHYSSVLTFNQSIQDMQSGVAIQDLERKVASAYQLSVSDIFARRIAEYQLARMNSLIAQPKLEDAQIQELRSASMTGVDAALEAVKLDGQEASNWTILGGVYGVLALLGYEGAQDKALEALQKSMELNPKNPLPYLDSAVVAARGGNFARAEELIGQAIALKPNYTEAFYLLSQIEIARGNIVAAIDSTRAVIQLEPQNAARYYQLGVLEVANKNSAGAIPAFEKAIEIDQNYANARYLLALAYDDVGRSSDARQQLEKVLELNPGNSDVTNLINTINTEGSLGSLRAGASRTVSEAVPETNGDTGAVSTTQDSETPLVTPVNTPPKAPETEQTQSE